MTAPVCRSTFMCMNVRGAIRHHDKAKPHASSGVTVDGRKLTNAQFVDYLWEQALQGRKVIPMAGCCGNPCSNAAKGCTGFDYSGGGCPGYVVEQPAEVAGRVGQ
jgi:hypothetical protein